MYPWTEPVNKVFKMLLAFIHNLTLNFFAFSAFYVCMEVTIRSISGIFQPDSNCKDSDKGRGRDDRDCLRIFRVVIWGISVRDKSSKTVLQVNTGSRPLFVVKKVILFISVCSKQC